ncbi:MAG: mechanosensitive ion channel family protein [Proteobacteria bacterium]|nr:mechanosensitive ion channel family protein [Pseudomonadota bacterium]MDA1057189.1 mechanosensitive ion channel family protein [Pseudomonadota bacterium]
MEDQVQAVTGFVDTIVDFAISYGFQIAGALLILLLGLRFARWGGSRVSRIAEARGIDPTLSRFIGNVIRFFAVVFVLIIAMGNLGVELAPIVAFVGAGALGATFALQGVLSNYAAGLALILTRPFVVGNTIRVQGVSGVVNEISLTATLLDGEDGERITIPNKDVVGQVLVNSHAFRIVETRIAVEEDTDLEATFIALSDAIRSVDGVAADPAPRVGLHDFTYGGFVIGIRFWVPSMRYFEVRYAANKAAQLSLRARGVALLPASGLAFSGEALAGDVDLS